MQRSWLRTSVWLALAGSMLAADLQVGASRVDITPAVADLPTNYKSIHDHLYVRTILLDNGTTRAAMVVADVPAIQAGIYNDIVAQVAQDANCPPANVMLAATHTHSSIRVDPGAGLGVIVGSAAFAGKVKEAVVQSVREARSSMRPARAGFGRGKSYFATNRNQWVEKEQRYIVGADRTGKEPFDPTVAVVKFEDMTGAPIALLVNYGIEPVVNGQNVEISGDVPGVVAKYVEDRYEGKMVTAFTVGAAGNPAYSAGQSRRAGGRQPSSAHDILSAMGTIMGEEVLAVSDGISDASPQVSLTGIQTVFKCAGKATTPFNLPSSCAYTADSKLPPCRDYQDKDAGPVDVRLGMLKIGDVALIHADANLAPALGLRLLEVSPLNKTVFVSLNFGPARFIVDDAAYPHYTYEVTATTLKKGCGESSFLNGALQLMKQ